MNTGKIKLKHTDLPLSTDQLERGLRVLQITDCHLYADPDQLLAGINTQNSLLDVIELARQQLMPIDMILATGDLVHDSSIEGYTRLKNHLEKFGIPVYCLPGNHDSPKVMSEQMVSALVSSPKTVSIGDWLIVLLDSTVPGSASGHMSVDELSILKHSLQQHPDNHILVCLHHHPVPIGSNWMDSMSLDNPDDFFGIINGHSKVSGILWGHIHQTFESDHNGIKMMGSPSTCIQFTKDQDDFGIDEMAPGFRWLELMPDGSIKSGIERVQVIPAGLKLDTEGY